MVHSGLDWHDICEYFEEDDLLRDLRFELQDALAFAELGELLFKIWKVASEEQFSWFVGTFEENLQTKHPKFFKDALSCFNSLCDGYDS